MEGGPVMESSRRTFIVTIAAAAVIGTVGVVPEQVHPRITLEVFKLRLSNALFTIDPKRNKLVQIGFETGQTIQLTEEGKRFLESLF